MPTKEVAEIVKKNFHEVSKEVKDLVSEKQPMQPKVTKVVKYDKMLAMITSGRKDPNQYDSLKHL